MPEFHGRSPPACQGFSSARRCPMLFCSAICPFFVFLFLLKKLCTCVLMAKEIFYFFFIKKIMEKESLSDPAILFSRARIFYNSSAFSDFP